MTIKDCIDIVDNLKPNQYSIKEKVAWLTFIEQIIINEVLKTHEGYDGRYDLFEGYSEDKLSVTLIVPSPYDRVYVEYLKMKIDSENGETARYNNSAALYNAHMLEFRKHYNKTHMPIGIHSAKHFPSTPGKVNTGLSEAEFENLKKDMTHILTEYFSASVSEDKLNDAVTKYIQNNREAFKGKDGKTPVKGIDYFTEEELNSIHSKCEDKIANSAKTLIDHLDGEMSRRLYLKEDTINKVDAFGDAEDKFKSYPSVFGVEAYGEELKSEIKNHYGIILDDKEDKSNKVQQMGANAPSDTEHYPSVAAVANEISNAVAYLENQIPKKLSVIEDDSDLNPVKLATSAIMADRADCDGNGKYIPDTYATKGENALKLDRAWKKLGEEVITEYDIAVANGYEGTLEAWDNESPEEKKKYLEGGEGLNFITVVCDKTFDDYVEMMAHIIIPKNSLNSATANYRTGLTDGSIQIVDGKEEYIPPNDGTEWLLNMHGLSSSKLSNTFDNRLLIHSHFVDGEYLYTEVTLDNYGSYKAYKWSGVTGGYTDRNNYPTKLAGKKLYWFVTDGYKLPAGTKMIMYAR